MPARASDTCLETLHVRSPDSKLSDLCFLMHLTAFAKAVESEGAPTAQPKWDVGMQALAGRCGHAGQAVSRPNDNALRFLTLTLALMCHVQMLALDNNEISDAGPPVGEGALDIPQNSPCSWTLHVSTQL